MKAELIIVTALVVFMFGCGNATVPSIDSPMNSESGTQNTAVFNSNIRLATSGNGLVSSLYPCNNYGFYQTISFPDYHCNIFYGDFETGVTVLLSNMPNASVFDSNDSSYVEDVYGAVYPFICDDELYLFKQSSPLAIEAFGAKALSTIIKMKSNGADRKILTVFDKTDWIIETSAVAYDDNNIFFSANELSENGEKLETFIMSVDRKTGERKKLKLWSDSQRYFIIGAAKNNLLIKKVSQGMTDDYLSQEHQIINYDIASGVATVIATWLQDEKTCVFFNKKLFLFESKTQKLSSYDIFSKSVSDLPFETNDNFQQVALRNDVFDSHLLFNCIDNGEPKLYRYSLDEQQLFYVDQYLNGEFVGIFGETKTDFLVITGRNTTQVPDASPDGAPTIIDITFPIFSLIKKQDYWSGKKEYLSLETTP